MIAVVTGAAGFIGSHLCEHLLGCDDEVRGIDSFTDYYPQSFKERNLASLLEVDGFTFVEGDLITNDLDSLLNGADVVYHLAGQPGVTTSWGIEFEPYVRGNVLATQRLLEACRSHPLVKFVYASSSSVYGEARPGLPPSSDALRPISPYGVTKLAGEHLCRAYGVEFSIPAAVLRLFTVYGPRQRPDMAFARLVACALHGGSFELRGDGSQTRDCTFVADVVGAMRDAARSEWVGAADIGGGGPVSIRHVLELVESMLGPIEVVRLGSVPGDVRQTAADNRTAAAAFGYTPSTDLRHGLESMIAWERAHGTVAA